MSKPVVFVIGASGNIGSATVKALSDKYQKELEIRAGVRNPDKADALKSIPGVTVVKAAMGSDQLEDVFKGVDRLYIVAPGTEDRAAKVIATAKSAKTAGVKYILALSVPAVEFPDTVFGKQLIQVETEIPKLGVPYTFLRHPLFIDNLYSSKDAIVNKSAVFDFVILDKNFHPVVVEDAGKAAAAILADPSKYYGKALTLCSSVHSYSDITTELSKALGKEVKYNQLPMELAHSTLAGMGIPGWQAQGMVDLATIINEGKSAGDPGVYESITGEKPTDLKTWVKKHADAFK